MIKSFVFFRLLARIFFPFERAGRIKNKKLLQQKKSTNFFFLNYKNFLFLVCFLFTIAWYFFSQFLTVTILFCFCFLLFDFWSEIKRKKGWMCVKNPGEFLLDFLFFFFQKISSWKISSNNFFFLMNFYSKL